MREVPKADKPSRPQAADSVFDPPALEVEPTPLIDPAIDAPSAGDGANGYSIATTTVIPGRSVAPKKRKAETRLQTKLAISEPGDPDEEEADRVADAVLRAKEPHDDVVAGSIGRVQRKESTNAPTVDDSSPAIAAARSTGGRPLDPATRADMEPKFGFDFGRVRVHTDAGAAQGTRSINAHAYTVGSDVVFAAGRYAPQSGEGRRLLAHELTHVVQQGGSAMRVSREPAAAPAAPAPAAAPAPPQPDGAQQMPPDAAAHKELEELEKKSFESAKSKTGQLAAQVQFGKPLKADEKSVSESFKIGDLVARPTGQPYRTGFDSLPPAVAYATIIGLGTGAVVVQDDKFFFAAKLAAGARPLNAYEGAADQKTDAATSRVNYVNPDPGVLAMTSSDGMQLPFRTYLITDADQLSKIGPNPFAPPDPKNPPKDIKDQAATPADAAALRALAGIPNDPLAKGGPSDVRDKNNQQMVPPDSVDMTRDQAEAFIKMYLRARGLEILGQNEGVANGLAVDFKTTPGKDGAPGEMSPKAKKMMEEAHKAAAELSKVLDKETEIDRDLGLMDTNKAWKGITGEMAYGGKSMPIWQWRDELKKKREDILKEKTTALQGSPLLAQLVAPERKAPKTLDPYSKLQYWVGSQLVDGFNFVTNSKPKAYGESQVKGSLFGDPKGPQNDEAIRAEFEKNLDAVRKAIRETRARMMGDVDFLFGLKGLQMQVRADLDRGQRKNSILPGTLDRLIQEKAAKDEKIDTGLAIVQVAALFLPGGQFLSAAIGFGAEVRSMSNNLKEWDASKAAVDPTQALADQQAVEAKLLENTVWMAINAADLGEAAIHSFEALEKGGKAIADPHPSGNPPPPGGGGGKGGGGGTGGEGAGGGGTSTPGNKTNTNWPPEVDPHGKTILDPNAKTDPAGSKTIDPNAPGGTNKGLGPAADPNAPKGGTNKGLGPQADPNAPKPAADPNAPKAPDADPPGSKTPVGGGVPSGVVAPPAFAAKAEVLDQSKYKFVTVAELTAGGKPPAHPGTMPKFGLIEEGTNKKFLFKPESLEKPIAEAEAMGVQAKDRARRAPAAADIAERLGVSTPKTRYVEWNGERGSLQEWLGDLPTLDDLKTSNPTMYAEIKGSKVKKDMDAFQYVTATLDQHEGNWLVKIDKDNPKKWELVAIDMDASLPPSAQRYTPFMKVHPNKQPPLPPTITRDFYNKLLHMSGDREGLRNALSPILKPAEIDGVMSRLDELLAKCDPKLPNPEIKIVD